tara:strand:- start:2200 stop:2454 length:255 start_codon:yes stop_codon:yes gene_type:complete
MGIDELNEKLFSELKLKSLLRETKNREQYWINLAQTLRAHIEKKEKSGEPIVDRLSDLADISVQQAHFYNALIEDLTNIKHGGS